MPFPFRTSAIFRNRWIALLWAVGICFTATEIVGSIAGVTDKTTPLPSRPAPIDRALNDAGPALPTTAIGPDRIVK